MAGGEGEACGAGNDHNDPMSSPWLASVTPIAPPTSANPTLKFLLYAATVTGGWSGLLCLLIYGIGRLTGVQFILSTESGSTVLPWIATLLVPIIATFVGVLLASLLRGRHHAGAITFWAGTVIALISMVGPIMRGSDIPTTVLLVLMHIITWLLVVPQIARIIGDSEPGKSVDRGE